MQKKHIFRNNKRLIGLGFALLIFMALFIYNHMQYTNVYIGYQDQIPSFIPTTPNQRQLLQSALNEPLEANHDVSRPSASEAVFTVELHHPFWGKAIYQVVSIDPSGVVILHDKSYYRAQNADFFYTQPYFDAVYNDQLMPSAAINHFTKAESLTLPASSASWQILKFDGNWYPVEVKTANQSQIISINRPDDQLFVTFDKIPDEVVLSYETAGTSALVIRNLHETDSGYMLPFSETDGVYHYHLTATWHDDTANFEGTVKYAFEIHYDRPTVFDFNHTTIEQGEPLIITTQYAEETELPTIEQSISDSTQVKFYQSASNYICYIPTNYDTSPGDYDILLDGKHYPVTVTARNFNIQHLIIDETVAQSTRNDAAYEEFDALFDPVRTRSSPKTLTSGDYILPATGRLSTEFGETRDVNGAMTTYRHSGLDIAAPNGTPVAATNSGNIVFSDFLTLTGNTIVIDHGAGIFSTYFHLSERLCQKGEFVEKGSIIGNVGSTGFSTGPHLHFILSFYDVNFEPGWLLFDDAVTYDNYKKLW
ncbi:M23 family metallopeptidase [Fusibacter paucivorans]|uniref:M23 family metallopeptidase n=1 Tax=Fusibacter paucivorans TaxID=76009 RepID=A0ABS5PRJ0_9FIRM|nr:M23 family metallopeptidase [Fusibacter paucivorans]MBS7527482.1 M23 family metallopeptidase [Fusibacter paucivorans]